MGEIETLFDTSKPILDAVYTTRLTGDLRLKMSNLGHHMAHAGLEGSDSALHHGHIRLQRIHHAANMWKVFKHKIIGSICHGCTLT